MNKGFTLIELLIAMLISGIIAAGIFTAFESQQNSYIVQDDMAVMQQNLRAGIDMMAREIRMAGYDPEGTGKFGIIDIRPRGTNYAVNTSFSGNAALQISYDYDGNGVIGGSEKVFFSICDFPISAPDGDTDLARDSGGGRQMLAENIEALGIAYAFDADGDGKIDTYNVSGKPQIIWAVDSNGDNKLDINLDTNGDGTINAADGPGIGGNGLISGKPISPVDVDAIRAVRIWILAETSDPDRNFVNTKTYVVGNKIITPDKDTNPKNDNLHMRLLTSIVKCRNLGL